MRAIRTHDGLFRFVFGEPEQMGELLRSNLPAAVAAAIDWRTLRGQDVAAALFCRFLGQSSEAPHILRTTMSQIHDAKTRQAMKTGADVLLEEGFEKGLQQGHLRGQRELLRALVADRFGSFPADAEARLETASVVELTTWCKRLLIANELSEVFGSE